MKTKIAFLSRPEAVPPVEGAAAMPPWRVALLIASSACLSGIAVVLWNRSALRRMRVARQPTPEQAAQENEFV